MSASRNDTFTWTPKAGEPFLDEEKSLGALAAALRHGAAPHQHVDVIVVDAGTLARLHSDFLGDPTETDVITFDLSGGDLDEVPGESQGPDGEIYVSADRARSVAASRNADPAQELTLYIVHGALHLAGMDDHGDEDRRRMRIAEREVLTSLGFPEDRSPHDID